MARVVLVVASIVWALAGAAGLALAAYGADALEAMLPPLAIDTAALRGAITTVSAGLVGLAAAHALVLGGLRRGRRWASTAGVLLAAVLAMVCGALAIAAVTSAVAEPASAGWLLAAAAAAGLGAVAYAVVAAQLVGDIRARGGS